jgi:Phage portal protein, SPP1 Gp6-like.
MSLLPSSSATPGTPEWWLNRLSLLLNARDGDLQTKRDYYEGRHNLRYADQKFREAFGSLFAGYAENICELIVDACTERMHVQGFRMGAKKDVEAGDADAWAIWQANQLDAQSTMNTAEKPMTNARAWVKAARRRTVVPSSAAPTR